MSELTDAVTGQTPSTQKIKASNHLFLKKTGARKELHRLGLGGEGSKDL